MKLIKNHFHLKRLVHLWSILFSTFGTTASELTIPYSTAKNKTYTLSQINIADHVATPSYGRCGYNDYGCCLWISRNSKTSWIATTWDTDNPDRCVTKAHAINARMPFSGRRTIVMCRHWRIQDFPERRQPQRGANLLLANFSWKLNENEDILGQGACVPSLAPPRSAKCSTHIDHENIYNSQTVNWFFKVWPWYCD